MKFAEYLKEKQGSPLYNVDDWFLTKYQHVERLGHDDVMGLLDGTVVVQEKLDGANFSVAKHPEKGLILASRNNVISVGGHPSTGFNGAIEYVLDHPGIAKVLEHHPDWVLRGEWLTRHTINYEATKMKKFYVFDVQDRDGKYVPISQYAAVMELREILFIPALAEFTSPSLDQLTELTQGPGAYGAAQKEGIVVKRYDFVNKWGRTTWGKLVSADFREANKIHMGATKHDPIEIQFASKVTDEDILKVIHKIRDAAGTTTIKDMPQVLGRVWNDAFTDRLWSFVQKEHVKEFNFNDAKRLVDKKTREVALAYYNGVIG